MKKQKGEYGYIAAQKKKYLLFACAEFGIVALLILIGILTTGNKKNLLTVIAICGCLPAAKMLVEFITVFPHRGISEREYRDVEEKAPRLLRLYDCIVTTSEKSMSVDALVIKGHTVCGYASHGNTDPEKTASYLKELLTNNRLDKMTVKIFREYPAFINRVEGMHNMAEVEHHKPDRFEEFVSEVLLSTMM